MDTETLTTTARVALGLIFATAGVGKLADRPGVVAAAKRLGVPPALAVPVARLLPVAELGVAATMLWPPAIVPGAAAGLFLLVLFTGLVVLNLRRGQRPPCHCFGRLSDTPIGPGTVLRNTALMGVAVVVLVLG